jgi:uncharacterized delta-60 repeat protein
VGGSIESDVDNDLDFLVERYTTSGDLDTSFGTGGVVEIPLPSQMGFRRVAEFRTLAVTSDNSIIAAGMATIEYQSSDTSELAIARFGSDGSLGATFGESSLTISSLYNNHVIRPYEMMLQDDGKIVIAGTDGDPGGSQDTFSLIRLTQTGTLDSTFGDSGTAMTTIGGHYAAAMALAQQSDGRIVAVGQTYENSEYMIALARFDANGILDNTFGNIGSVTTEVGTGESWASTVAVQDDGKILIAGSMKFPENITGIVLARYYP